MERGAGTEKGCGEESLPAKAESPRTAWSPLPPSCFPRDPDYDSPMSEAKAIPVARFEKRKDLALPLFLSSVQAGFPSPAEDHVERSLDLNEFMVQHPQATFFMRVQGTSMSGAGIQDGDLLLVDRAVEAGDGRIVVAVLDGELTVKRLRLREGKTWLEAANASYPALEMRGETADNVIWGVVVGVVRKI